MKKILLCGVAAVSLLLISCDQATESNSGQSNASQKANAQYENESQKADAFFEQVFNRELEKSPEFLTYIGRKKDKDQWDEYSEEKAQKDQKQRIQDLEKLATTIDFNKLDDQTKLSYRLFKNDLERDIENFKWRYHRYALSQMRGWHSSMAAFLINFHTVKDLKDAQDYVSRLQKFKAAVDERLADAKIRDEKNVIPPKFALDHVTESMEKLIKGVPYETGEGVKDNVLLADFKKKVNRLEISDEEKKDLVSQAQEALLTSVKPAYEEALSFVDEQKKKATTDDGIWKIDQGVEYYQNRLEYMTTTKMTAEEIHNLGLEDVKRIHNEMKDIMKQVKFEGGLQDFFEFMRTDKQFLYDETEEGRQTYLDEATRLIEVMKADLDKVFLTKPKADLIVKRVEAFREKSAGKAFYNSPALDGSRPGIYYANLYKMSDMPTYQMEALAYHEGIPGHHMQLAINQELENVPMFRKFSRYTAYSEGWGLYSEFLPKEMGYYKDPYSNFGRLAMELWRACRLVVDTGIHAKKWTREEAIDYLKETTPNPEGDIVRAIERYIVMPGQATAYKIGMIKIVELREEAKKALGDKFDIREFHDVVLTNGAVPLNILEENVKAWTKSKQ